MRGGTGCVRALWAGQSAVCVCVCGLCWQGVRGLWAVSVWPVRQHVVPGSAECSRVLCGSVYATCLEADSVRGRLCVGGVLLCVHVSVHGMWLPVHVSELRSDTRAGCRGALWGAWDSTGRTRGSHEGSLELGRANSPSHRGGHKAVQSGPASGTGLRRCLPPICLLPSTCCPKPQGPSKPRPRLPLRWPGKALGPGWEESMAQSTPGPGPPRHRWQDFPSVACDSQPWVQVQLHLLG